MGDNRVRKGLSPGTMITVVNLVSLAKGCYALAARGKGGHLAANGEGFSSLHTYPRGLLVGVAHTVQVPRYSESSS
jgi:hypothetical protein